jgi:endonuclease YncB( thermonuclease family)
VAPRNSICVLVACKLLGLLAVPVCASQSVTTVPVVPSGEVFQCTPTRVWDGDGPVWCAEGPRVRLAGIAAREIDDSCRPNQPCPTARGAQARDGLVKLIGAPTGRSLEGHVLVTGPAMRCVSAGNGVGTRTAAWCVSPLSGDVSCAMVKGGWTLKWDRYWQGHNCG